MNKGKPRLIDYLVHMSQAIERVARYTDNYDEVAFLKDEMVQDAVIRNHGTGFLSFENSASFQ